MSAIFTTLAGLCASGDHILACRSVFGSTHSILTKLLPKWNISHTYAHVNDTESWESLRCRKPKFCLETPSNPAVDILDLQWLGEFSKKHNLILIVDNCFATPYLQQPIQFGADVVLHSATKYLDGQGRVLGGIIAGRADLMEEIRFFAPPPDQHFLPLMPGSFPKAWKPLAVRMDRHCENAIQLAKWLEEHPDVEFVK
ncbi:MAG: PLP-dependent transferase [Bacteroidia bacterium]